MSLTDFLFQRRSIRKFTAEAVSEQDVKELMRAALCAPTSKNSKSWEFVFVTSKAAILELSKCKEAGAQPLEEATLAVVVMADPQKSDVWIEDASVAATYIQLQAQSLGYGSCWVQVRERGFADGRSAEDIVRHVVAAPDSSLNVLCIIAIGHKNQPRNPYTDEKLPWSQARIL